MRGAALAVLLVLATALAAPAAPDGVKTTSLRAGLALAAHRVVDLDGDGAFEVVLVGRGGEVRVYRGDADAGRLVPLPGQTLVLPDPERTLIAFGDVLATGGPPQLVTFSPRGLTVYPATGEGFPEKGVRLLRRQRFELRLGAPRFAEFLNDLNADGRLDLVLPKVGSYEIWLNRPAEGQGSSPRPEFRRTAVVRAEVKRNRKTSGGRLSDQLEHGFSIPALRLQDVNGDGRRDLIVVDGNYRGFHMQRRDGSIPRDADVELDLGIFKDTTPRGEIRPGRTLAGDDRALLQIEDLDGDEVPDYLISHRRKLWVFHGSPAGPQFTKPTTILRTAEDITALLVLHLDDDGKPDLLLVRVQVPSVGAILKGLYSKLDVEISATGYGGQGNRAFDRTPRWRGTVTLRLPEIMGVIRNPDVLLRKFEQTASRFRASATADVDGDGSDDLAMLAEDGDHVEIWRSVAATSGVRDETGLRSLFFESEDRTWTIERILAWLGDLAERRAQRLTGGRDPDLRIEIGDGDAFARDGLFAGDLTGDGRSEILIVSRELAKGDEGVLLFIRIEP
jgi:hypothetical protein